MTARNWSADVRLIGDRIAALTPAGAVELSAYLESVHGLSGPAPVLVPDPRPDRIVNLPVEPVAFRLLLDGYDPLKKITLLKAVRARLGLSLIQARDFIETGHKVIATGLSRADAEDLQKEFAAAGAHVSVQAVAA